MPGPEHSDIRFPDPVQLSHSFARVAERSQRLVVDFLARAPELPAIGMADPQNVGGAFLDLTTRMLADPMALARAQVDLWTEHALLWTNLTQKLAGLAEESAKRVRPTADSNTPGGARSRSSTTSSRVI